MFQDLFSYQLVCNMKFTLLCLIFVGFHCGLAVNCEDTAKFQVVYEWKFVNFTWSTPEDYKNALDSGKYIPQNNVIAGIKTYKDKVYLAMPRVRPGTPVTLGYISTTSNTADPLVTPFPDWSSNTPDDCTNLENVQSMEIDNNGVMWVLDGFRIKPDAKCPPKLLLLDLNDKGKLLHSYTFPEEICLSRGGFLNDIVVDDTGDGYAYITDNGNTDPGLIVYSKGENRSWKFRDASMFPEVNATNYVVGGEEFRSLAPIDGIALSPKRPTGRSVFYCALTGFGLYSISTDILRSEEELSKGTWRARVKFVGSKQAQSDGLVIDNKGNLYYGLLPLYGVGKWNIDQPFSTAEIIDENNSTMVWTDSFAFDDKGYLYLLANNIHKFFDPKYVLNVTNNTIIRILKLSTSSKSYLY